MRGLLILAVVLPLAILWVWVITRPIIARLNREKRLAEMERENERLDALIDPDRDRRRQRQPYDMR
jgi:p-aminobenzoyl-glutamate transporter AbgT